MKISVIKKLVETYNTNALKEAEENLLEEKRPEIDIEGEDEGEQLTHVIAAQWILKDMNETGEDYKKSLRRYTQKVRNSIS